MKHILIIALILLFSTSGWAQESNQDSNQKIKDLEIKVLNLENHQKLFDATIEVNRKKVEIDFDSKLSEIKKENSFSIRSS